MAQAVQHPQQRKELELVFSLQSHYKHFFKNYGDIVGVYDIPSITMQWESFKSYLLKNSGIMFDNTPTASLSPSGTNNSSSPNQTSLQIVDDIHIRYVNTSGVDLPINTQEDFQYALYSFRERARSGEINHLKLTRVKGITATPSIPVVNVDTAENNHPYTVDSVDADISGGRVLGNMRRRSENHSGGDGLLFEDRDEQPPEWFSKYMKKLKQEIIQEITKVNTTQMSNNLKKMQAANHVVCPKRRQNKSEHYKRRPKMSYANNIAAMENTSCDNTDINTIATTPIMSHPSQQKAPAQKFADTPLQKSQTDNKPIKLKAKRVANTITNLRGSSDSDTLTVIKRTNPKENNDPYSVEQQFKARQTEKKVLAQNNFETISRRNYSDDSLHHKVAWKDNRPMGASDNIAFGVVGMGARILREERKVCMGHHKGGDVYLQEWQLENTGCKSWDNQTELRFGWGSIIPIGDNVVCPPLKSGERGCVAIYFKIPERIGSYECYCHLHHQGRRFGPWLGFRVTVNGGSSPQLPKQPLRATVSTLIPPQIRKPDPLPPTSTKLHQSQSQEKSSSSTSSTSSTTTKYVRCVEEDEVKADDVVAVIQGVVLRNDSLAKDCAGDEKSPTKINIALRAAKYTEDIVSTMQVLLPNGSFKRFKANERLSNVQQEDQFKNASPDQKHMRYANELQQNQQVNKQLQLQTDSDNDEEYSDDGDDDNDVDDDDDAVNVGKDLVMVEKQQLQDNSDSDNASIVSIAESVQSNRSVAGTNACAARSFSSGNGSASEEFVVIPMPPRNALWTLTDGEDNSCPELEMDPHFYENIAIAAEEIILAAVEKEFAAVAKEAVLNGYAAKTLNVSQVAKQDTLNAFQGMQPAEQRVQYTELPLDSLTVIERAELAEKQIYELQRRKCENPRHCHLPEHLGLFSSATERVGENNTEDVIQPPKQEVQTCPVDLSTNSSSKCDFVSTESGSKKSLEKSPENKQHCAATLCDLCTNFIMKNNLESSKKRLFVFPEDSPGFEVFSSPNKNSVLKENQKSTNNSEIDGAIHPINSENPQNPDVIIHKENNSEFPAGIWTVKNNPFKTSDIPNCNFLYSLTADSSNFDCEINPNELFSSNPLDVYKYQPDLVCWKNDPKVVETPKKVLTADEIRLQMRDLFVQLAELEPQKDPYLVQAETSQKLKDNAVKIIDDDEENSTLKKTQMKSDALNLIDSVLHDSQALQQCKIELPALPYVQINAAKRSRLVCSTPIINGCASSKFEESENTFATSSGGIEALTDQFQINLRLNDIDEPMPNIATKTAPVVNEEHPVGDDCFKTVNYTGCPYKTHLFQEHAGESNTELKNADEKLIDVPSPDASFIIEGNTAPIENQMAADSTEEQQYVSIAVEQQRLIQLHCNHDTALAENMNILFEMGFRNFYSNLQLLKAHENNIVLVLEQLLPTF